MITVNKSELPPGITITEAGDYRNDPVHSIIKNDCYNKCYICEEKEPTCIHVEHRIAHKGDPTLKYDWANLYYSCYHCNTAKGTAYNNILDCITTDPEEYIALSMKPYPREYVEIHTSIDIESAVETATLLELIYNGNDEKSDHYNDECGNLRIRVFKELINFQQTLIEYEDETDVEIKRSFRRKIVKAIDRSANFAAFKRKVIRDNPVYSKEFAESALSKR